jgi:hypothetical protein
MLTDDGSLSCANLYNVPYLGWADFSMTSTEATSRIYNDNDSWSVDVEFTSP